jgi:hypothetical protein
MYPTRIGKGWVNIIWERHPVAVVLAATSAIIITPHLKMSSRQRGGTDASNLCCFPDMAGNDLGSLCSGIGTVIT